MDLFVSGVVFIITVGAIHELPLHTSLNIMAESVEEIKKHIRVYITVFISLAILTIITVAASYLELNPTATIVVALIIASVKASLVAGYFMHLFSEKFTIYLLLIFTTIFFLTVLLLPAGQHKGHLTGLDYVETSPMHVVKEHH